MNEDISLREVLRVIWQGRYIVVVITFGALIITLLSNLVFTKPLYQANAILYVSIYQTSNEELIESIEITQLLEYALMNMVDDPMSHKSKLEINEMDDLIIEVAFRATEREFANEAVEKIAQVMHEMFYNYVIERAILEKELIEMEIVIVDKKLDIFMNEFSSSLKERLALQENNLENTLNSIDEHLDKIYGNVNPNQHIVNLTSDPVYIAFFNKKVQLMAELTEIRLRSDSIQQGQLSEDVLCTENIYNYLVENRDYLDLLFFNATFNHQTLIESRLLENVKSYIDIRPSSTQPLALQWKRDIIIAGILGFMLSVAVIFVKLYITELTKSYKQER